MTCDQSSGPKGLNITSGETVNKCLAPLNSVSQNCDSEATSYTNDAANEMLCTKC